MAKIRKPNPYRPIYPTPTGLITSVAPGGAPNIITLGEVFNLSIRDPVWVGIAMRKATYSHELISRQREYVVNLPTSTMIDEVLRCGSVSGRDGIDKFTEFNLTPVRADKVQPPLIDECPVNLECRVVNILETGDHDLFIGNVLVMHVDEDLLDEQGEIVLEKLDTIVMVPGGFTRLGPRVEPSIAWPPK